MTMNESAQPTDLNIVNLKFVKARQLILVIDRDALYGVVSESN